MSGDAAQAFQSLVSAIPQWIAELEEIVNPAVDTTQNTLQRSIPPERQTQSHDVSSGIPEIIDINLQIQSSPQVLLKESALDLHTSLESSQPLKRKAHSAGPEDAANLTQPKSKVRREIVYDGQLQKRLESLVRAIGMSRNIIRKGKISAKVEALASSELWSSDDENSSDDAVTVSTGKAGLFGRSTTTTRTLFGRPDRTLIFDQVDKHLDEGQSLVEKAAYLLLRNGQAKTEMAKAGEHFGAAHTLAIQGSQQQQKQADRSAQRVISLTDSSETRKDGAAPNRLNGPKYHSPLAHETRLEIDLEAEEGPSDETDSELAIITSPALWTPKYRNGINPHSQPAIQHRRWHVA